MKNWPIIILALLAIVLVVAVTVATAAQNSGAVPKYDPAAETRFKGTVDQVVDRECPVSGGMGSHLILNLPDGKTIEVHLASTKFVKTYELVFKPGDQVEILGTKVQFEGKETIFAREVTRGTDTFAFRDKDGTPIW